MAADPIPAPPPVAAPLMLIFGMNTALLAKAFDGVGDDQLWHRPSQENNPMLWIAGHMVVTRASMLQLLGSPIDTGWGRLFARGAALGGEEAYPAKAAVMTMHAEVASRVQATLAGLSAIQLAREATVGPKPGSVRTVGDQLGFFAMHDSYHLGQLAYIRKALGLSSLVD
jgi:DinB superfamily